MFKKMKNKENIIKGKSVIKYSSIALKALLKTNLPMVGQHHFSTAYVNFFFLSSFLFLSSDLLIGSIYTFFIVTYPSFSFAGKDLDLKGRK
jgi:hypothetical protein